MPAISRVQSDLEMLALCIFACSVPFWLDLSAVLESVGDYLILYDRGADIYANDFAIPHHDRDVDSMLAHLAWGGLLDLEPGFRIMASYHFLKILYHSWIHVFVKDIESCSSRVVILIGAKGVYEPKSEWALNSTLPWTGRVTVSLPLSGLEAVSNILEILSVCKYENDPCPENRHRV